MAESESSEHGMTPVCAEGRSWWNYEFSPRVSAAIVLSVIIAPWIAYAIESAGFWVPWPVAALLFFGHWSALGGLIGAAVCMNMKKPNRGAFIGALAGMILSAVLMT